MVVPVTPKQLLRRAVKTAARTVDRVRPPAPGVVVLIYHRIGGQSGLDIDLPVPMFDEQMAALAESGDVVSLGDGLAILRGELDPPRNRSVVITFDDGTADFVDAALPVLVRHELPATLYVATEFIESGTPFPNDATPVSWGGLADAVSTGLVDIGSHTHRHRLLDRLSVVDATDELDRSIDLIVDRLGRPARDFAYPKAVGASGAVEGLVRSRFRSAAVAGTRPNRVGTADVWRLSRSPIQRSDGMTWFGDKVNGGMRLEDDLRRMLNRRRYANTTT